MSNEFYLHTRSESVKMVIKYRLLAYQGQIQPFHRIYNGFHDFITFGLQIDLQQLGDLVEVDWRSCAVT